MDQGIDLFFSNRSHAVKFVEFIGKVVPSRSRNDKQLVSHDPKSNNYNYKYTFSVEISPVCREDLICLPPKVSNSLGNLGPLVICTKVSNHIALLDPFTLRNCFLDAEQYWRASFKSLLSSRQLVEYIVLDIEAVSSEVNIGGSKYALADAQAMADQIEQMGVSIENLQKQLEELQSRHDSQVQQCSDLTSKLDATQKQLNQTSKVLSYSEEQLRQCQYTLKERDFIISEQKKAENALAHQACVLRADLEKSIQENASLFQKIAREDKLNTDNRSVVDTFQSELAKQLGSLSSTVAMSVSRQNEHLQRVEKICRDFLESHDKAALDLTRKINSSKALYKSHFEAMQNVVRLHKATSNAALEEISTLASSNSISTKEVRHGSFAFSSDAFGFLLFLDAESAEANLIFDELQSTLSTHQGEMAKFARELRQRFNDSTEHLTNISEIIQGFFDKLLDESKSLERHSTTADEIQTKSIAEFEKAYEEQSRSDAEKLIAEMTSLVSNHMRRQKELVCFLLL
ncbi:hypothetical protein CQW23_35149 [Capsicum baccatum]|uniref:60S ribosomal export protein NMD3 n=2 Tax=Capsicum baccatum TaxID=33114 RepID=A0A2G2UWS7_CAPBA|nr:hypothetical protein CQW23_35149 [Capsicum baccatum]